MSKLLFGIIVWLLAISSAQATLITSFEGGSALADNGLTLTQGIASRATIQFSASSNGATLMPTDSTHLLKMIAGTSADIINPAFPNDLVTLVSFDNPVTIDKSYFLIDFAFMNRDSGMNDRQRIGINGTLYDITGSAEVGNATIYTPIWQTLAISFASMGSIDLSLGCVNDTYNSASSYCLWDNFRTADSIPIPELAALPVIATIPQIDIVATAPIPEPETYAMLLAGLALLAVTARRRKLATVAL